MGRLCPKILDKPEWGWGGMEALEKIVSLFSKNLRKGKTQGMIPFFRIQKECDDF
jgi:hypothetical protein